MLHQERKKERKKKKEKLQNDLGRPLSAILEFNFQKRKQLL